MISREEVIHIAKLARLELTEQELLNMQKDLSSILDYFNVLNKVPKLTEKSASAQPLENRIREDQAIKKPLSTTNNLVAAAPDRKEDYIKVKSIL